MATVFNIIFFVFSKEIREIATNDTGVKFTVAVAATFTFGYKAYT